MTFLNQLNAQEKKVSIYLLIGALFFLLFDYSIASFFHSLNYQTKSLFGTLTHFGDSLYFFIPTILTWALVKIIKSKNQIINTISEISLFIFLNILLSGIVTQILKHVIGRPRPVLFNGFEQKSLSIISFDSKWHSFPSGHTATIFAFIFCMALLFPKIKNILITFAIIIASTRVIVGAHFISDIFGGALVAYLSSIFISKNLASKKILFTAEGEKLIPNSNVNIISSYIAKVYKNIFSLYLNFNFYFKTLTITLLLSIVFFLFPSLDITVSGLFFGQDGKFIATESDWFIYFIRKMLLPLLALLVFFVPIAAVIKQIYFKEKILNIPVREWVYLFSCLIVGTGVVVNSIFKNLWGRARPNDTIQFGGQEPFTIPWLNVDYCNTNCSFVSGDVSFFTLSLALLIIFNKTSWNTFAYAAILLISLLRIMEGDHFLSDTVMSFIITYVIIIGLKDIFKNFPEDLNLNQIKKFSLQSKNKSKSD